MSENQHPTERIRVWWIPQIPGRSFFTTVPTIEVGELLCDTLARYDKFQYEQNVKPDYCNAGGIQVFDVHEGEWNDIDPEDDDDMEYALSLLEAQ